MHIEGVYGPDGGVTASGRGDWQGEEGYGRKEGMTSLSVLAGLGGDYVRCKEFLRLLIKLLV